MPGVADTGNLQSLTPKNSGTAPIKSNLVVEDSAVMRYIRAPSNPYTLLLALTAHRPQSREFPDLIAMS
jgi:hypothetical protein